MKYFTEDELKCSHCGKSNIDENFMKKVEVLREQLGFPFPVNSGYRCPEHPIEAKKPQPGYHEKGAVDVAVSGEDAWTLINVASSLGWGGIGVNTPSFIHLDRRSAKTVWKY